MKKYIFLIFLTLSCSPKHTEYNFDISRIESLEFEIFKLVNLYRDSIGLNKLQWNSLIANISRSHSQHMAVEGYPFSHDGFEFRVINIKNILVVISAGENLAYNTGYLDPAHTTLELWQNSPEHKKNIEGNYNLTGVGVFISPDSFIYFTQIFVKDIN